MAESTIALLIMAVVIVVFVVNRLPVGVVAIGAAVSLWATGLLELEDALRGFGNPVVVFIGTLFIVSEAIDATGLTTWIGNRVTNIAGSSFSNVMVSMMLLYRMPLEMREKVPLGSSPLGSLVYRSLSEL